jgi:precorrin-4 methylase
MFELLTGWRVGIEPVDTDSPYIIVPAQQLGALCLLLTEHRVPHVVEGAVPSRHHADTPFAIVVRLGHPVEVARVQDILDTAP